MAGPSGPKRTMRGSIRRQGADSRVSDKAEPESSSCRGHHPTSWRETVIYAEGARSRSIEMENAS